MRWLRQYVFQSDYSRHFSRIFLFFVHSILYTVCLTNSIYAWYRLWAFMIFSWFLALPFPPRNHPSEKLGPPPSADASSWSFAAPNVEPISCQNPVEKNHETFAFEGFLFIFEGGGGWTWKFKISNQNQNQIKSIVSSSNPWTKKANFLILIL